VDGVAAMAHWLLPGFTWQLGLVLGAVVCTTDAIAATAIARRLGLPQRLGDILEGESLVNDASGLLALQVTTAVVMTGHMPTIGERFARLAYLIVSSIVIGLVLGKLVRFVMKKIDDAQIEITISVIAPYFAYLTAESLHSSGVLATVVCGLFLGHTSSTYLSLGARLQAGAVWETLTFVLNGVVFLLIGLQLLYFLADINTIRLGRLILHGLMLSAIVILLRMFWMYPGAWIASRIRTRLFHQQEPLPSARTLLVAGWTGMRGVVALAAAISLPETLNDGTPFPHRAVIIFLTYCVIFVTLVLQGLTLPPLIRWLGLANPVGKDEEEIKARREIIEAALAYLEHSREDDRPELAPVYDDLIRLQLGRLTLLQSDATEGRGYGVDNFQRYTEISRNVLALQRGVLLKLRNEEKINDQVLRRLETELDLIAARNASLEGQ